MITVALTGGSGFVGRHLLRLLLARGIKVRSLVRDLQQIPRAPGLTPIVGRLDQPDRLDDLVNNSDAVVHLAGATGGVDYQAFAKANVTGTHHLLSAAQKTGRDLKFIHLSSLAAREPQLSDYAASKRDGEALVQETDLNWTIIRPPAVYGPDDPALAPLWRLLAHGWLIRTGPPHARFSLLHVQDLATAILQLLQKPESAQHSTFELDDGHPNGFGWQDLADLAGRRRKRPVRIIGLPPLALKLAGQFNVALARLRGKRPPPLVPGKVRELVHHDWVCDNSALPGCETWRPSLQLETALHDLPGWRDIE